MSGFAIPNYVGIGCRRCASSWTHRVLNEHPDVGKRKEGGLHFFSDNWDLGESWYRKQFEGLSGKRVVVDFSISYSYPEHLATVPARIFSCLPKAKLFIVVRHPAERAYSDYLRSIRMGELNKGISFNKACEDYPVLLARGLYGQILGAYLKYFDAKNMCVLFYEDLLKGADIFLRPLFDFMGIDLIEGMAAMAKREKSGGKVKSEGVNRVLLGTKRRVDSAMAACGMEDMWDSIKARSVGAWGALLAMNHQKKVVLSKGDKKFVAPYFREDVQRFSEISGRELPHWLE
tara:strand:+ start:43809 stop:44675 length:867 start_codon:yes stop_codon:yes gene_type:complete